MHKLPIIKLQFFYVKFIAATEIQYKEEKAKFIVFSATSSNISVAINQTNGIIFNKNVQLYSRFSLSISVPLKVIKKSYLFSKIETNKHEEGGTEAWIEQQEEKNENDDEQGNKKGNKKNKKKKKCLIE